MVGVKPTPKAIRRALGDLSNFQKLSDNWRELVDAAKSAGISQTSDAMAKAIRMAPDTKALGDRSASEIVKENNTLKQSLAELREIKNPLSDQPPIILLREADGYYFPSGSAELSPGFSDLLIKKVVPRIRIVSQKYRAKVIEIIGHTDEVPLRSRARVGANLDSQIIPWLAGRISTTPKAFDNVGLGMARAVAVVRVLSKAGLQNKLVIVPLSAGAMVLPNETIADGTNTGDSEDRRRIEIRVRRKAR